MRAVTSQPDQVAFAIAETWGRAWLVRMVVAIATFALTVSTAANAIAATSGPWVVADGRVYSVDLERHQVAPLVALQNVRLHAAESDSVHWLVAETTLIRIDLSTGMVERHSASALSLNRIDAIATSPLRGGVWVVDGRTVNIIAADGHMVARNELGASVLRLGFDTDGQAWALTADAIVRFGPEDRVAESWTLPETLQHVSQFVVDPYHDVAWAMAGNDLVRISVGGALAPIQRFPLGAESAVLLQPHTGALQVFWDAATVTFSHAGKIVEVATKSATDGQLPIAAFVDPARADRVVAVFSERATVSGGPSDTSGVRFSFVVTQASVAPVAVRPVLRILQPPKGSAVERPLPSLVVVAAQACGPTACPLPDGYWSHHSISVEINGRVSASPAVLELSQGIANLADLGDLAAGPNSLSVSLLDRDQRVVARATSDFEVVGAMENNLPPIVPKANSLPALTLTSPAAGAVFTASATIAMAATATDSDGSIAKVDFLRGTTVLGTDTTAPYTFSWTSVPAGAYTLSAKATDNAGGSQTSATVSIVVNAAPTARITAPVAGTVFTAPANITIAASASDTDGTISKVDFYAGATLIGTKTAAPYSLAWNNVAGGTHSLTVKATDNRGAVTTSAAVSVIVNKAPTILLSAPIEGALYGAPATIALQATASDPDGTISKVEFYSSATRIGIKTAAPYTFNWANVAVGNYTLTAKATDNRSSATTSTAVHVTIIAAPTISLVSPSYDASFQAPANVLLGAAVTNSSGSITKVEFFASATLVATVTQAPFQFAWLNVPTGSYNLTAKVTTDRGLTRISGAAPITVSPQVALTLGVATSAISVDGESTTIFGTVQAPANSAVLVNNTPALVGDDGVYFADNVPLTAGSNTINVVVNSLDGRTLTKTIALSATGTPTPITLTARPNIGMAPLYTTLRIGNATGAAITKVEFDQFGTGDFKDQFANVDRIAAYFTFAGSYRPRVRITDDQNRVYIAVTTVIVRDGTTLDQLFQAMWSGMNDALVTGNLTAANRYLTADAQKKFGAVFTDLNGQFPGIVASYRQFWLHRIDNGYAEYVLIRNVRGTDKLFLIYFMLDNDGSWRIGEM